ncbi:hypothetical protein AADG42_04820 [Ammonicoccus fulvus]|uniref:Nitrite/Sulfite reductase ferredoxin-like domain-containing protein n=1 Tax=Ammonicoccus fulvus TaxID=3138240 RepID=A0ABZ3FKT9_9ACTN
MVVASAHRTRADLCPGVLRPFPAEDGAIIRLRLPGGELPIPLLTELLQIALSGAGFLQVTNRGNLQVRGLPDPLPDHVADAVAATGLVPSPTHERVRNILMSPLSGLHPRNTPDGPDAHADVRPIVAEFDALLRAEPALAQLPGRFLVAIDDGRGDMLAEPFDMAYRAVGPNSGEVRLASGRGFTVPAAGAAAALIEVAKAFQQVRTDLAPAPWHIRELDADLPGLPWADLSPARPGPRVTPGRIGPHVIAGLPLARITPANLATLEWITDRVILTGRRSIVVPDAADHVDDLREAGFAVTPESGWARVSACTGAPGCGRATVSTEVAARDLVTAIDAGRLTLTGSVHLVACERHCGVSGDEHHIVLTDDSSDVLAALLP